MQKHFTHAELNELLERARRHSESSDVIERLEWFVDFHNHGSISETCSRFSIARSTFYRWYQRLDVHNLDTLRNQPKSRLLHNNHAPQCTTGDADVYQIVSIAVAEALAAQQQRTNQQHAVHCPLCKLWAFIFGRPKTAGVLALLLANLTLLLLLVPQQAIAASPFGILINTEGVQTIREGGANSNIDLQFGNTVDERLTWDRANNRFNFSDDVHVTGNISGSGTITVDGAAVFGSTISLGGVTYTFPAGDGTTGQVLQTNGAGTLTWADGGAGGGISQSEADLRYVEIAGDTMTGGLAIHSADGLASTGSIITEGNLTVNADNNGVNAVITFGNDVTAETIQFNDSTNEFDISDDLNITGTLDVTDTITTDNNLTINADFTPIDAILTFGNDVIGETLRFSDDNEQFEFSDDIHASGNITTSGSITALQGMTLSGQLVLSAQDANIRFGGPTANHGFFENGNGMTWKSPESAVVSIDSNGNDEQAFFAIVSNDNNTYGNAGSKPNENKTLFFIDENGKTGIGTRNLDSGSLLEVTGTISGTTLHAQDMLSSSGGLKVVDSAVFESTISLGGVVYTFPGSDGSDGYILQTNGAGTLSWVENGGFNQAVADDRYVNLNGDTMTGGLAIHSSFGLASSGSIVSEGNLSINSDNAAQDAVLTFGNDALAETITFSDTNELFIFSDDVHVSGNVTASGSLTVETMLSLSNPTELTINNNAVTITKSYHTLDTESNNALDDLSTIHGGNEGDIIIFRTENTDRDVTLLDDQGNIHLNGNFTLNNNADSIMLMYGYGSNWFEVSRSDNGA